MINQRTDTKYSPFSAVMACEEGYSEDPDELAAYVEAWAYLIATGLAWTLPGRFGRAAANWIEQGVISPDGQIDWVIFDEEIAY